MTNYRTALTRVITLAGLTMAALTAVPTTPARAAGPVDAPSMLTRSGAYGYGTGCVTSNPFDEQTAPLPLTGARVTRSSSGLWTVYKNNVKQLDVTPTISSSGSVTQRNGRLDTFDFAATGGVTVNATAGQGCGVTTGATVSGTVDITTTRPSWLSIRLSATRQTDAQVEVEPDGGETGFGMSTGSAGGSAASTFYLPAGTYRVRGGVGWAPYVNAGEGGKSRSGSGSVHVEFDEIGEAFGVTTGTGAKYVNVGSQVACSDRGVAVRFGKRIRSAAVYVDGRKAESVNKPKAGRSAYVAGLDRYRTGKVQVRLVVDPPGKRKRATVVATRSYRPCEAR